MGRWTDNVDLTVRACGRDKTERIALGLALLERVAIPGVRYMNEEIAAWCGCTGANIQKIEQKALQRLRTKLLFHHDPVLRDLVSHLR